MSSQHYDLNYHMVELLQEEPFLGGISRCIEKRSTNSIPTAGVYVDPQTAHFVLMYNPEFLEKLTRKEKILLLKHEFYHLILEHVQGRAPSKEFFKAWNHATDLAINSEIFPDTITDDVKSLYEMCLMPGKAPYEKYAKKQTAESYFYAIKDRMEKGEDVGDGGFDQHDGWSEEGKNPVPQEIRELAKERFRQAVKDSSNECMKNNSWGNISESMKKEIQKMLNPVVDWKKEMRYFCKTSVKADRQSSIKKINKRYQYIHSGKKTNRTSNIAICVDQSGSVSDAMLMAMFAEMDSLSKYTTFTVIPFDDQVSEKDIYVWKKGKNHKWNRCLQGGTSFINLTTYINDHNKFDGIVVATDMYAEKPQACKVRRMWLVPEECSKQPYFSTNEKVVSIPVKNG